MPDSKEDTTEAELWAEILHILLKTKGADRSLRFGQILIEAIHIANLRHAQVPDIYDISDEELLKCLKLYNGD
jgi:hypothetical protein